MPEWLAEQAKMMAACHEQVRKYTRGAQMRQKRQYDKRVMKGPVVMADQFCMVYSKSIPKNMVSKLHPKMERAIQVCSCMG